MIAVPSHMGSSTSGDVRSEADRSADRHNPVEAGLTAHEARQRLQRYGPNTIEEERRSLLLEVASHFWGPIPWMIEAAIVLTAATGRWLDLTIIGAVLLLNGTVGFWEEHQAQSAIAALRGQLALQARVRRDGEWRTIPSADVVPGDVVRVQRGEVLPADGQIVSGDCETDESALTGESLPVGKQSGDGVFTGSAVTRGAPVLRVLATGARTQFGRTAQLAGEQAPSSHFQQAVVRIGKYLIALAVALVAVIVVVSLLRGAGWAQTMEFALVVTVASIPVALPAVLSVTMAVGARQLARHDAVVRHLPAVEEMAGVDVLCSDKTGTLTANRLTVVDVVVLADDSDERDVLRDAALTAEPGADDPIDQAILDRLGDDGLRGWHLEDLQPFDPTRKYSEAHAVGPGTEHRHVAKGAVQAIAALTRGGDVERRLEDATRDFAERGYRALAVARRAGDRWRVVGLVALHDPPREDSADTLRAAQRLGLAVKMITGDRGEIARELARQIGLGDRVLDVAALREPTEDGRELASRVEAADGFAEVVPEDKYRIVRALQERGHIVGMTGDGVNDAPALRRADAGIAVSGATDAARAASDIVLLAPGLSTIVEAVHRAREVFQRMQNYSVYRITETVRVVLFVTVTIVAFDFFPVSPSQVVLLAILNDAAILSIAYDRVVPSERPERWDLTGVLVVAATLGLVGVLSTFLMVWTTHGPMDLGDDTVRTIVYLKLSVSGHLTVFLARTRGPFWSHRPAGVLLAAVLGTQVLATVIALTGVLMQPIGWRMVGFVWGWAFVEFLLLDPIKVGANRLRHDRAVGQGRQADEGNW